MSGGDLSRVPGIGLKRVQVEDADGELVEALLICGIQSDGTVTPVLVDSDGKLITTT